MWERACSRRHQNIHHKAPPLHTLQLSAIIPPIPIREIVMRRLLCLLFLVFVLPASATGLLENRPSSSLGSINNSADFLPVREAFQLSLVDSTPQSIKLRFVAAEGYYLYRHRFQFRADPADILLGAAKLPNGQKKHDEYFGDVEVYHGILDIELPRTDQRAFTLVVTYQGCADKGLCYPPETERLSIDGSGAPATAYQWSWRELALFFLAGLGLTFTPCVLPMLPILSGVVLRDQVGGLRGFNLSLAYVCLLYTSPSPRDQRGSRMPSSA